MNDWIARIADGVHAKEPPNGMSTRVVAIDGPGGSGKSSLADRLAAALHGAPIVHTDDFASWDNPVDWWPRLVVEVLEPLSRGSQTIRYLRSSWGPGHPEEWREIPAAEFVVLEGVTAAREAFRPFLTYADIVLRGDQNLWT